MLEFIVEVFVEVLFEIVGRIVVEVVFKLGEFAFNVLFYLGETLRSKLKF